MKTQAGWIVAVFAALAVPVQADIIAKAVKSADGKVATGYVLQGSYKMRGLGKRRISVSAVPSVRVLTDTGLSASAQAVIPILQNSQLQSKPRFGYGSDYEGKGDAHSARPQAVPQVVPAPPQAAPAPQVVPQTTTTTVIRALPIYTYPYRPREYYPSWGRWYGSTRWYGGHCRPSFGVTYSRPPFAFSFGW